MADLFRISGSDFSQNEKYYCGYTFTLEEVHKDDMSFTPSKVNAHVSVNLTSRNGRRASGYKLSLEPTVEMGKDYSIAERLRIYELATELQYTRSDLLDDLASLPFEILNEIALKPEDAHFSDAAHDRFTESLGKLALVIEELAQVVSVNTEYCIAKATVLNQIISK